MAYSTFSTEDFIRDDFFQQWVSSPNEETNAFWETFLAQHPHQKEAIQQARQFISWMKLDAEEVSESKIHRLKDRIDLAIDESDSEQGGQAVQVEWHTTQKRTSGIRWYGGAASVVLLLSLALVWKKEDRWIARLFSSSEEQVIPRGQQSMITLADGTKVWMNADTRLDYPKDFLGKATREVYLEGEAFFEVTEDQRKPFIVHTSNLSIKVLGTAFNVKSYPGDETISTTLVRGKVSISSNASEAEEIILTPRQQAIFTSHSQKMVLKSQINTESYTGWRQGELVFHDEPLSVIIPALERRYDVTIELDQPNTVDCHFSAKFNNKTLEEVLELFKTSETIDYKIVGKKVRISGKLCEQ